MLSVDQVKLPIAEASGMPVNISAMAPTTDTFAVAHARRREVTFEIYSPTMSLPRTTRAYSAGVVAIVVWRRVLW
jgi:hypothetical protein